MQGTARFGQRWHLAPTLAAQRTAQSAGQGRIPYGCVGGCRAKRSTRSNGRGRSAARSRCTGPRAWVTEAPGLRGLVRGRGPRAVREGRSDRRPDALGMGCGGLCEGGGPCRRGVRPQGARAHQGGLGGRALGAGHRGAWPWAWAGVVGPVRPAKGRSGGGGTRERSERRGRTWLGCFPGDGEVPGQTQGGSADHPLVTACVVLGGHGLGVPEGEPDPTVEVAVGY
jgi:hypothetical protein